MKVIIIGIITIIAILGVLAGTFWYAQIYEMRCVEDGGKLTSTFRCTYIRDEHGTSQQYEQKMFEREFYGKPLSYWKNLDEDSLVNHYENFDKPDEHFFEDLGALLIKSQAEEKLHELEITPASEIEIDWSGIRPSLPPRMGFYATVNSTDGKSYRITGTIHGNVIQDNFQIVQDNGRRIGWTPAFEYDRVQINGTTALQICSIIGISCIENPVWDAVYRHDKDFTYFIYETSDIEHYVKIDNGHICHSIENFTSQEISELECQEISNTKHQKN